MGKHVPKCRTCRKGAICVPAFEELQRQLKAAKAVGWHLSEKTGDWVYIEPAKAATDDPVFRYYAVIRYSDPARKLWFGPYIRYGTAANVVAAHKRKGRDGYISERKVNRARESN